jgi:hypothetical protein
MEEMPKLNGDARTVITQVDADAKLQKQHEDTEQLNPRVDANIQDHKERETKECETHETNVAPRA